MDDSWIHPQVCHQMADWLGGVWFMKSTHTYVHNIKTIVCEMAQLISQVKYLTIQNLLLPWVHNGLSSLFLGYNQVEFNKKKICRWFFLFGWSSLFDCTQNALNVALAFLGEGLCSLLILSENNHEKGGHWASQETYKIAHTEMNSCLCWYDVG